jgi:hypothetical protein
MNTAEASVHIPGPQSPQPENHSSAAGGPAIQNSAAILPEFLRGP